MISLLRPLARAILVTFIATVPSGTAAQESGRIPRAKLIAVNVLIGGAVGGAGEAIHGRSFWRGFLILGPHQVVDRRLTLVLSPQSPGQRSSESPPERVDISP